MKKYLLIGGDVTSKNDGQSHRVGPYELMRLYGLDPHECVLAQGEEEAERRKFGRKDLIVLRPRYDGNYTLETATSQTRG